MTDVAVGAAGGLVLGTLFFGGLWLTVRRVASGRGGVALTAFGYLGRLAVVGAGLVWLAGPDPLRWIGALLGLVAARELLVRRLAPAASGGED